MGPLLEAEVLGSYEPAPSTLTNGYRTKLPECVSGLCVVNDSPATLKVSTGPGSARGTIRRTVYPYSWVTLGASVGHITVQYGADSAPSQNGDIQIVATRQALAWDEGLLRGSEGLTIRAPVSGNYSGQSTTAAQNYVFGAQSGEIMFWNFGSTSAYLNFNGTAATGGSADLEVEAGAFVQLGVSVSAISVYGTASYGLEVWR